MITVLPADVIFPILFILHEIEYRDKLDSMDAREAEGEENEIHIFLQLDHGAGVVGVDGDVCSIIIVILGSVWEEIAIGVEGREDYVRRKLMAIFRARTL